MHMKSIRTPLLGPDPVVEGLLVSVDVGNVGVKRLLKESIKKKESA